MLGILIKILLWPFRFVMWLLGLAAKSLVIGSCGCLAAAGLALVVIIVVVVLLLFG